MKTLRDVEIGQSATVKKLHGEGPTRRRIMDMGLTKGADIIRSRTYEAFLPLIAVALIYLVMVMIFQYLVNRMERKLRTSDR